MWNSSKHDQLRSEIKHIFENGTLEEKMSVAEIMYKDYRQFDDDVKIEDVFVKSGDIHINISSRHHDTPIMLTRDLYGSRWKSNGSLISLAAISEMLGVPIAFVSGILFAFENCPSVNSKGKK